LRLGGVFEEVKQRRDRGKMSAETSTISREIYDEEE
jgi:hypothetical protein